MKKAWYLAGFKPTTILSLVICPTAVLQPLPKRTIMNSQIYFSRENTVGLEEDNVERERERERKSHLLPR